MYPFLFWGLVKPGTIAGTRDVRRDDFPIFALFDVIRTGTRDGMLFAPGRRDGTGWIVSYGVFV